MVRCWAVRYGLARMSQLVDRGVAELPVAGRGRPPAAVSRVRRAAAGRLPRAVEAPSPPRRDAALIYTALLAPVAIAVASVSFFTDDIGRRHRCSASCSSACRPLAGLVPVRHRLLTPRGWSFLRLTIALLFVWALVNTVGGPDPPALPLYLPVVVAAAALGPAQAIVIGVTAAVIYLVPELATLLDPATVQNPLAVAELTPRGPSPWSACPPCWPSGPGAWSPSWRRSVPSSAPRPCPSVGGRGRLPVSRQVSRLLVTAGATPELLDRVADVMVERFGYALAVIFIAEGNTLKLGAQRGYTIDVSLVRHADGGGRSGREDGGGPARAERRDGP